jgi:hypothetical protein
VRTSPFLRRAATAVAAVALVAGCGSSSPGTNASDRLAPAEAVRAAAAATEEAGSSRFMLTSTTAVQGQTIEVTGEGVFDPAARTGRATFTLPGGAGTMEQVFLGEELYLSVPGMPGFYRLAVADLVGTDLQNAAQPTGSLDMLQSVSDDVEEVGTEKVRDEQTTHYSGTLDARAALDQVGGSLRDTAEQGFEAAGVDTLPFEAWIDDDGRLRKLSLTMEVPASDATGGQPFTSVTEVEMYDFGVDVDVEAPPADQVQDGAPLLALLRGQQPG